jgi:ABC-type polysaccharide/polyol phosphate export permease
MWTIILLAGFWLVPIIWDYHIILENYKFMAYNPITGFLIGIRQITLDNTAPASNILGGNFIISLIIFMLGYVFMMKKSKKALEFL